MKKILLFAILALFIPVLKVKAVDISSVSLTGTTEAKKGDTINVSLKVNFSNLERESKSTTGIALVIFELNFDEKALVATGITVDGLYSSITKLEGKYYGISQLLNEIDYDTTCANGLYCRDYEAILNFNVIAQGETTTSIQIGEIAVGLIDVPNYETEDDIIEISKVVNKIHSVAVKSGGVVQSTPKDITTTEKPVAPVPPKSNSNVNNKSSNALLKSLKIENYSINFDSNTMDYVIKIKNEMNQLKIEAIPEDSKTNIKIIGSEDLKANNNKVLIETEAEDGTQKTYSITTEKIEKNEVSKEQEPEKTKQKEKINQKFVNRIIICLVVIILIIIIGFIISKIKNRKLNKLLDQL